MRDAIALQRAVGAFDGVLNEIGWLDGFALHPNDAGVDPN